jgi:hypothetical protein
MAPWHLPESEKVKVKNTIHWAVIDFAEEIRREAA